MHSIRVRNVNEALPLGLQLVKTYGRPVTSRGLSTLEVPGPVVTIYERPWERVLFDPVRDANPFFHFFESMWVLAGANTVNLPAFFLPKIKEYSDDGHTFHGAYGDRLRHWGSYEYDTHQDQITKVIQLLKDKPDTRQAVMSIWNPELDLGAQSKDIPCNDMVMFKVRDSMLNMTVCNRSNDVIWGAYGANVVQFSILQEYIAASCDLGIGHYAQMSDSYHVYEDLALWQAYAMSEWRPTGHVADPYDELEKGYRLFDSPLDATKAYADAMLFNNLAENNVLTEALFGARQGFQSRAFQENGLYMLQAYMNHKMGDASGAMAVASHICAPDWRLACMQWLSRRVKVAA